MSERITEMQLLFDKVCHRWKSKVIPPTGLPSVPPQLSLPDDLMKFYSLAGGMVIDQDGAFELHIVSPENMIRANPVICDIEGADDYSFNWFILASYRLQYVTIDLNQSGLGRCYDSFWDCHAVRGSCTVLARSFTEFLERVATTKHDAPVFWQELGFSGFGDAYDTELAPNE